MATGNKRRARAARNSHAPHVPQRIPKAFRFVPEDVVFKRNAVTGVLSVMWGWKQWRRLAAAIAPHVLEHGRAGIVPAIMEAQGVLPLVQQRPLNGVRAAFTQSEHAARNFALVEYLLRELGHEIPHGGVVPNKAPPAAVLQAEAPAQAQEVEEVEEVRVTLGQLKRMEPKGRAGRATMEGSGVFFRRNTGASITVWKCVQREGRRTDAWVARLIPPFTQRALDDAYELAAAVPRTDAIPDDDRPLPLQAAPSRVPPRPLPPPAQPLPMLPASDDPTVAAFLQLPLGALLAKVLPALAGFVRQSVADVLEVQQSTIAAAVRVAVIEVVGAPPTPPAPPPGRKAEREPEAGADVQGAGEAGEGSTSGVLHESQQAQQLAEQPQRDEPQPQVQQPPQHEPAPVHTRALSVVPRKRPERPHDLQAQLEGAAQALGIPMADRPSVCVVGLHPRVEDDLERGLGRLFHFNFKRPDSFNCAGDVPASSDAVLLCRKTLNHDLKAAMRRYALPTVHVSNSADAVAHALRSIFPEVEQGAAARNGRAHALRMM